MWGLSTRIRRLFYPTMISFYHLGIFKSRVGLNIQCVHILYSCAIHVNIGVIEACSYTLYTKTLNTCIIFYNIYKFLCLSPSEALSLSLPLSLSLWYMNSNLFERLTYSSERICYSSERICYLFERICYLFQRFTNKSGRRNIFFYLSSLCCRTLETLETKNFM